MTLTSALWATDDALRRLKEESGRPFESTTAVLRRLEEACAPLHGGDRSPHCIAAVRDSLQMSYVCLDDEAKDLGRDDRRALFGGFAEIAKQINKYLSLKNKINYDVLLKEINSPIKKSSSKSASTDTATIEEAIPEGAPPRRPSVSEVTDPLLSEFKQVMKDDPARAEAILHAQARLLAEHRNEEFSRLAIHQHGKRLVEFIHSWIETLFQPVVQRFLDRLDGLEIKGEPPEKRKDLSDSFNSVQEALGLDLYCKEKNTENWRKVTNSRIMKGPRSLGSFQFLSGQHNIHTSTTLPRIVVRLRTGVVGGARALARAIAPDS